MTEPLPPEVDRALTLLERLVTRSERRTSVPFPVTFFRAEHGVDEAPPLSRILGSGGRGGDVRLKLYMSLTMLATAEPYRVEAVPSSWWAEALNLPDPMVLGARRISDALNWLEGEQLIELEKAQGRPSTVTMLSPSGTGRKYSRPQGPGTYTRVPTGLWSKGWITLLSGRAIAVLLVLIDRTNGGRATRQHIPGDEKLRHGLSDSTWTRATAELKKSLAGGEPLLIVERGPAARDFTFRRLRNIYTVNTYRLGTSPFVPDP